MERFEISADAAAVIEPATPEPSELTDWKYPPLLPFPDVAVLLPKIASWPTVFVTP